MSTLTRPLENPVSEFFQWLDLNRPAGISALTHVVPVDSYLEDGAYVVRADLPGIDPDQDVEVTVDGDILTIHGERKEEKHDHGHSEVRYGSFTRSVRLPQGTRTDEVTARYDAGVLTVAVPMTESRPEPITIPVQRAEG